MAIPQSFLYERYEARYEFLRGRGGRKIDFRASKAWMYVLFAGFAFGYCGCFDNEIITAFVPETTLLRLLRDEGLRNMISHATDGLMPTFKELNIPPRPATAYMLYSACTFIEKMGDRLKILNEVLSRANPLIEMDRVAGFRSFTLVERISMDFGPLLKGLSMLSERSITWIRSKARRALVGFRGAPQHFGDYATLTTMLFQVLTGSRDPTELCYYALRVVAEHEIEGLKTEEEKSRRLVREGKIVRKLLRELVLL